MPDTAIGLKKYPKQARSRQRLDRILTATENLLVEHGVPGVTTTSIAKYADIPVGSIYQYFDSREDILEHLYLDAFHRMLSSIENALADMPLDTEFPKLIRKTLNYFWQETRRDKSFKQLTRWHNRHHTLFEITPDSDSEIPDLISVVLRRAGLSIAEQREKTALNTLSAVISLMIDLSIEEDDDTAAYRYIEELQLLLESYVRTFD